MLTTTENLQMTLKIWYKSLWTSFKPLQEQLSGYHRFRREAVECLNYIYLKYERNIDSMDRVLKCKVEVWSILPSEVQIWLN